MSEHAVKSAVIITSPGVIRPESSALSSLLSVISFRLKTPKNQTAHRRSRPKKWISCRLNQLPETTDKVEIITSMGYDGLIATMSLSRRGLSL
ncbi:MAG: hypothetical protein ACRKGH_05505 [Dehalogenimonas sp.]